MFNKGLSNKKFLVEHSQIMATPEEWQLMEETMMRLLGFERGTGRTYDILSRKELGSMIRKARVKGFAGGFLTPIAIMGAIFISANKLSPGWYKKALDFVNSEL